MDLFGLFQKVYVDLLQMIIFSEAGFLGQNDSHFDTAPG